MTRLLNLLLLLLILVIGGPVWYLLIDSSPRSVKPANLNLDEARRLANQIPGPLPERVEYEVVALRKLPGNVFAAGSGLKGREIGVLAFRLVVRGKPAIMIETGITSTHSQELGFEAFDRAAQDRLDKVMRGAGIILTTHEHGDHLGGLAELMRRDGPADLIGKAMLNRNHVPANTPSRLDKALPWPPGLRIEPKVDSTRQQAIAPGVVTIPTHGHTPGSQMIFVKLANGSEFLFAGDTAPMAASWSEERPPSRLITDFWAPEDRKSLIGWLKALHLEHQRNRKLFIIPGHDYEWLSDPANLVPITRMPQ